MKSIISVSTIAFKCAVTVHGLVKVLGSFRVTSTSRLPKFGRRMRSVTWAEWALENFLPTATK